MTAEPTEGARRALIEQCRVLLMRRRNEVPCSHNLLAQLRDDAADQHIGDAEAQTITTILNAKILGQKAANKGVENGQ